MLLFTDYILREA